MAIFDFGNLKKLLETHHPSEIIIVDADFFVNHPDFRTWDTFRKISSFRDIRYSDTRNIFSRKCKKTGVI